LNYWLISDRAKQFLEWISQTDFTYLAVDTEVDAGSEPATYWLCDAIIILDAVDEAQSAVKSEIADDGSKFHSLYGNFSLAFDEKLVGEHCIFRMKTSLSTWICTGRFKLAFKESGLTGLSFEDPFQPPFDKIGTVKSLPPAGKITPHGRGQDITFRPEALENPNELPKIGQTVRVQGRYSRHYGYRFATRIVDI
jgi:hypothetical protein